MGLEKKNTDLKRQLAEANSRAKAAEKEAAGNLAAVTSQLDYTHHQLTETRSKVAELEDAVELREIIINLQDEQNRKDAVSHQEALQKAQEEAARLKAFARTQVAKMEDLRREKVAAEERAALSATEKRETERNAAAQLSAAHQQTQDAMEALQKAEEETAREKASAALQATRTEDMHRQKVAAQQSAALAIRDRHLCERSAAEQLHAAHKEMAAKHQEVMELTIAAHAVNHRAARAMEETAIAREAAHCAHSHHEAAARRAGAAEAALAAAHTATQLAHAEAGTALEANRLLQAELDARVTTIRVLQSQVEDAASPTMTASTPGLLKPTATWLADQALEAFSHPLLSSEGFTGKMVRLLPFAATALDSAPAVRAMLRSSWLSI